MPYLPIIALTMAVVLLLYLNVVDHALKAIHTVRGLAYDNGGMKRSKRITVVVMGAILLLMTLPADLFKEAPAPQPPPPRMATFTPDSSWMGMDTTLLAYMGADTAELVRYGRQLIANTAQFLGPQGTVAHLTNGMNCQNCHLDAGTRPWGNNYGAVWSTYPKFRARSGANETVSKRVNDCFERSLNGTALDTNGKEMKAILAYMQWLGTGIARDAKPKGSGIMDLPFLDRAADPRRGEQVYTAKCASCHQPDGQGMELANAVTYQYPPLWGEHSYNIGAGLFRLSRFAGYVKNNMPQGASWENPLLTDEEAWDVAAYVNSRQRPDRDLSTDWPKIAGKPVDHPFGPYADKFKEKQHKFGPFAPIAEAKKAANAKP